MMFLLVPLKGFMNEILLNMSLKDILVSFLKFMVLCNESEIKKV